MSGLLEQFIEGFVLPLLAGGPVEIGRPIRPRDHELMLDQPSLLGHPELLFSRLRRARELTPHPGLPDPDRDELALWVGLHNALVFDHPERHRVWARASTWRRVEGAARSMFTLPMPADLGEGLARHVSVGAFIELRRVDTIVATATGELRYLGQSLPRRLFGSPVNPSGHREETVRWLGQPHAPETHRLVEDAMRASPLTCLLHPLLAPPGWSPLWAVDFLRSRPFARAVVHRWAAHSDWIAVGGAVTSALLPVLSKSGEPSASRTQEERDEGALLALPGTVVSTEPEALAAVVGALVHLHFLKVLELEARLGVASGSRDPGILSFLALPLLLPSLSPVTGTPLGGLTSRVPFETQADRRWTEYVDHLAELVPRSVVENLLATLVPSIVKTA